MRPVPTFPSYQPLLNIGAGAESMAAFTGVFQNRFNPSANAIWTIGKHTITFGGSFAYTQLNTRDRQKPTGHDRVAGHQPISSGPCSPTIISTPARCILSGNPNRYWRSNETGEYIQDKFQFRPNLAITAGLRFDWMAA